MIKIGYAGILQHYPKRNNHWVNGIADLFWTYRPDSIDPSFRSPLPVFKAMEKLKKEKSIGSNDIQLHLWGSIDPYYQALIEEMNLGDSIFIQGFQSNTDTIKKLKEMDLLFLPLEKSNSSRHRNLFIPSKLFEYISINKPILGLCEDSEAKEILESSGLGKNIDPENENELVNYLHQLILNPNLLDQFKRNDDIITQFSAETATQKLANIFNQI